MQQPSSSDPAPAAKGPAGQPISSTVGTAGAVARQTLRRWQFWLILIAIGVLAAALVQFFSTEDDERYGLGSTSLEGYGALAEVLQDHGVDIHRVYTAEDALRLMEEHPEATLTVFDVGPAAPAATTQQLAAADRDLVWLDPADQTLQALFDDEAPSEAALPGRGIFDSPVPVPADPDHAEAAETPDLPLPGPEAEMPECRTDAAQTAGALETRGTLYTTEMLGEGDSACFAVTLEIDPMDGTGVQEMPGAALLEAEQGTIFGSPAAFTNQNITTAGHAALALQLFGQQEQLIWYTPTGGDLGADDQWTSPWDYMPDWVGPLSWWLLVCTAVLILVQGRRHGPVIEEPLPVQVPGSESAEGRGRLYQSAEATVESARTLRSAHLLRTSQLLRLGRLPAEHVVLAALVRQTGRELREITETFDASRVRSNAELVRFARRLLDLENDLRAQLGHGPRDETDGESDHDR